MVCNTNYKCTSSTELHQLPVTQGYRWPAAVCTFLATVTFYMPTPEFRTQSTHYHHRDNTTEKVIANTTASGKISEGRSSAPDAKWKRSAVSPSGQRKKWKNKQMLSDKATKLALQTPTPIVGQTDGIQTRKNKTPASPVLRSLELYAPHPKKLDSSDTTSKYI